MGGIKLERFLPKNQRTQRKFLNFENRTNQGAFYKKDSLYPVAFVNTKSNNKPDSILYYIKLCTVKS